MKQTSKVKNMPENTLETQISPATEDKQGDIISAVNNTRTTVADGNKDVTTAGSAEPLVASSTPFKNLDVQAKFANTGNIYIGGSTVSSSRGIALVPGSSRNYKNGDLNDIYIDVDTNGEGVTFSYEN